MKMTYQEIRTNILIALYTDEELCDYFYLKGGGALLAHGIHDRASSDIDVSLEDTFEFEIEEVREKLEKALTITFQGTELTVIDVKLITVNSVP